MIMFSEEGMLKAETGQNLGLLDQTGSQAVNAKVNFLMEIKSAILANMQKINETALQLKLLVVWIDQTSYNIPLN